MTSRNAVSGTLVSVDTARKELTVEESVFAFEAEPAVDYKSFSYDLGDDWDDQRIQGAVGEHVVGTLVDGVIRQLRVR